MRKRPVRFRSCISCSVLLHIFKPSVTLAERSLTKKTKVRHSDNFLKGLLEILTYSLLRRTLSPCVFLSERTKKNKSRVGHSANQQQVRENTQRTDVPAFCVHVGANEEVFLLNDVGSSQSRIFLLAEQKLKAASSSRL